MDQVSLVAAAQDLLRKAVAAASGRAAQTIYGGQGHVLRQTVMAMRAGTSLAEHESPGDATLHVLVGRVRLVTAGAAREARSGDLLVLPRQRHSLEALDDAVVLLTVATT